MTIAEQIGGKKGIASSLNGFGIVYDDLSDYDKALDYFLKSLKIMEEIGNKQDIATSLNNIGTIYWRIGNYDEALEFFTDTLKIDKEMGNKSGIASSFHNIGMVYDSIGERDKALKFYLQSLKIKKKIGKKRSIAYTLNNIGNVHYGLGNYHKALEYNLRSLRMMKELGDKNGIAGNMGNIGASYIKLRKYDEALKYLEPCILLAGETKAKNLLRDNYENLSELYEGRKDYHKALQYFRLFYKVDKEIFNEEKSEQIARLQTRYETDKKEIKIQSLEKEQRIRELKSRVRTIVGAVIILTMMIGLFFIFRSYRHYKGETIRQKEKLKSLQQESRLKLFLAGIDKHFLFNSLDSVIGLEKVPSKIKTNLEQLSNFYRYLLTATDKLVIPLTEELDMVKEYLKIEKAILKNRLDYSISQVEDQLMNCEIMPQTILTLVENAVKHGIQKHENGGTITIEVFRENHSLIVKITDTGVGIDPAGISSGFGLYSVQERLRLFYKNQARFSIKALGECGTQAIMEVPCVRIRW
ncbi:MAG: tetratricopeptide repeat protein [Candidatus Aenigmarchaeota archaeon]|nr:tetratricopeptide repeat protein [Candidatus Aenigmarchaeota archaeon]